MIVLIFLLNILNIFGSDLNYNYYFFIPMFISLLLVNKNKSTLFILLNITIIILSFFVTQLISEILLLNHIFISALIIKMFSYKDLKQIYSRIITKGSYDLEDINDFANSENTSEQGDKFEALIAQKLEANYDNIHKAYDTKTLREKGQLPDIVTQTGGKGEQGLDNVAFFKKAINIYGKTYEGLAIQAKHYSGTVGNKAVQEIHAACDIYSDHFRKKLLPMVVTNSSFSKDAILAAQNLGIEMIEESKLMDFLEGNFNLLK